MVLVDGDNESLIGADRSYPPDQIKIFKNDNEMEFFVDEYPKDTTLIISCVYYGPVSKIYIDFGTFDSDTIDLQLSDLYKSKCGNYYLIEEFRYNNQIIEPDQLSGKYVVLK